VSELSELRAAVMGCTAAGGRRQRLLASHCSIAAEHHIAALMKHRN